MPYYFECPACDKQHGIAVTQQWPEGDAAGFEFIASDAPDRTCDRCGADGCVDCLPREMCAECEGAEPAPHPETCLACLNGWSH